MGTAPSSEPRTPPTMSQTTPERMSETFRRTLDLHASARRSAKEVLPEGDTPKSAGRSGRSILARRFAEHDAGTAAAARDPDQRAEDDAPKSALQSRALAEKLRAEASLRAEYPETEFDFESYAGLGYAGGAPAEQAPAEAGGFRAFMSSPRDKAMLARILDRHAKDKLEEEGGTVQDGEWVPSDSMKKRVRAMKARKLASAVKSGGDRPRTETYPGFAERMEKSTAMLRDVAMRKLRERAIYRHEAELRALRPTLPTVTQMLGRVWDGDQKELTWGNSIEDAIARGEDFASMVSAMVSRRLPEELEAARLRARARLLAMELPQRAAAAFLETQAAVSGYAFRRISRAARAMQSLARGFGAPGAKPVRVLRDQFIAIFVAAARDTYRVWFAANDYPPDRLTNHAAWSSPGPGAVDAAPTRERGPYPSGVDDMFLWQHAPDPGAPREALGFALDQLVWLCRKMGNDEHSRQDWSVFNAPVIGGTPLFPSEETHVRHVLSAGAYAWCGGGGAPEDWEHDLMAEDAYILETFWLVDGEVVAKAAANASPALTIGVAAAAPTAPKPDTSCGTCGESEVGLTLCPECGHTVCSACWGTPWGDAGGARAQPGCHVCGI